MNPAAPYTEAGFTLTPTDGNSAVFDAAYAASSFPGDTTSWFGFAPGNTITLTGPVPFSLDSLLAGPSTIGSGVIDFSVTGFFSGGGSATITFVGLTTATSLPIAALTNLQSATFSTTSDAGLDDIVVNTVPEPATLLLLGTGLASLLGVRRWRSHRL